MLKYQIEKWNSLLATYPPQIAIHFLYKCMDKKWHYIMETSKTLEEVLEKFASLASSEDLLLEKMLEQLKS